MAFTIKSLYTALVFCIIIIEAIGINSNDSSTDESRRTGARGRIIKLYSGTKPEPVLCTGEGFMSDPHNCAIFYRCVKSAPEKYTVFRFQCGPGTVYDPDKEVCNHPQYTARSECGGILPNIPQTTHVNDIQSNTYNEIPSPMVSHKPIYPSNAIEDSTTSKVKQTTSPHEEKSTTKRYITSTPSSYYSWSSTRPLNTDSLHETILPIVHGDVCTSDGFMGDTQNCRKFYRCVANQRGGFTKHEFMCSETTVWDDVNQICNHVWAVKKSRCSDYNEKNDIPNVTTETSEIHNTKPHNIDNTIKNTSQQQLQVAYGTKVHQTQTQIGNGFVNQNQTQINYGDRLNPSKSEGNKQNQTQISYGSAISQSQTQINYGDKGIQTQVQIDHSKEASQSQIQISETSTKKSAPKPGQSESQEINQSSTKCTEDGFVGDSMDCRKFYRCINNGQGGFQKIGFSCADGTAWDNSIKSCNHLWAVEGCKAEGPESSTSSSSSSSRYTVTTTTTYRTTLNSHTTTSTEHTTPEVLEDNVNTGYGYYKPDSKPTSTSTTTITSINDSNSSECNYEGFMGDDNDCKIFYRCVADGNGNFIKHTFRCAEGTVWDSEIKACNHEWAVSKCGNLLTDTDQIKTSTEKIKSTTPYYMHTTMPTHLVTLPSSNHDAEVDNVQGYGPSHDDHSLATTSSERPPKLDQVSHICTSDGFKEDKDDCTKFYRCIDNQQGGYILHEFTCSPGTLWDVTINACNHASAVDRCSGTSNKPIDQNKPEENIVPSKINITSSTPTASSTTASNISASSTITNAEPTSPKDKCTQSGFIGDSNNCKRFYRCVEDGNGSFIKYDFLCGEGTLWDDEIKSCNHAWAVTTCGTNSESLPPNDESNHQYPANEYTDSQISTISTTSTETTQQETSNNICVTSGFFGDSTHCERFYRCVDNGKGGYTRFEYTCGEGTVWDQNLEACNHRGAVKKCGNTQNSSIIEPNKSTTEYSPVLTSTLQFEDSSVSQNISDICKSEGFCADLYDCRKFYRCVDNGKGGYIVYNFNCGDGTSWDQNLQTCNHESLGKCANMTAGPIHTTERPKQQESISTTTEAYSTSPSSTYQCEAEGFFAVPNNCKNFIRCVNNNQGGFIKYEFACSEGTVWVQEMLTCYHDTGEVYCNQSGSKPVNVAPENYQTTEKHAPSSTNAASSPVHSDENVMSTPSVPSSGACLSDGYYPNEKDCRRYYQCVDNGKGSYTKYDYVCGEGTAWDNDIKTCNHIRDVPSCKGSVVLDENKQTTTTEVTSQNSPSSTTTSTTSSTPQEAINNNDQTNSNSPDSSRPASNSQGKDTCASDGFFGNTQDCKKFHRCVDDGKGGYTKYDFICAEGTIWDKDISVCNHPSDVANPSCNRTSTTEDSISNSSSSSSTETNQGENSTSEKPGSNDYNCTKAGFYPDPNNCKKFYRCVDWDGNGTKFSIFHFDCGEGTIWDPAVETCNHENAVFPPRDCSGSQTATTEGTTTVEKETTTVSSTEAASQSTSSTTLSSTTTSTPSSTTSTTPSTTKSTTESAPSTTDSTTVPASQSTTERSEETTTEQSGGSTTQQLVENTTKYSETTTTEKFGEETQSTESTTEHSGATTTEQTSESTTQQLGESTTEQTGESTTEKSVETTTEKLGESTTEQGGEKTTEQIGESTTEETGLSTTEKSEESTTEQLGGSTTEKSLESTTEMITESTTENMVENTSTAKPANSSCPETEDDQFLFACPTSFRRHPKYCNLFYQCDENEDNHDLKIAVFNCPNNTIYDEKQIKCVHESKAQTPCNGEISQKRRVKRKDRIGNVLNDLLVVPEKSFGCTTNGYFAFEKEGDCSPGFFKCTTGKSRRLRGLVYQCPEGYLFWTVSRRCEPIYKVSDCKRSLVNDWSRRPEIPIERKNVSW